MTTIDRDELRAMAEELDRLGEELRMDPGTLIAVLDALDNAEAELAAANPYKKEVAQ